MQNKGGTTTSEYNVIFLENLGVLTGLLRSGAGELITQAVQTALAEFLSQYQDVTDSKGRPLVVRNGYLPQREIMTGIGPVDIKVPKTRACVSKTTILTMVYKLELSAEKGKRSCL